MIKTKFYLMLTASNAELEAKKAMIIAKSAEAAYRKIKVEEENKLSQLEIDLAGNEDVGKKQTTDLLDIKNFRGDNWASNDFDTIKGIIAQRLKTEAAVKRYNDLFGATLTEDPK